MRRANQPLLTAAESLIGIAPDDPLKAAKRNARFILSRYDFSPLPERREVVEECHAGRVYKLYARMTSRVSNDAAVISVLTDGCGAFWGYETVETTAWAKPMTSSAYWIAAKAFVETWQAKKAKGN
jgi:hypothetical protein